MTAALTADTSVTVAASTSSLPAHDVAYAAFEGRELRLVDHVLLETYSVLTRLPEIRLPQELAAELLRRRFPAAVLSLPTGERARLVDRRVTATPRGGARAAAPRGGPGPVRAGWPSRHLCAPPRAAGATLRQPEDLGQRQREAGQQRRAQLLGLGDLERDVEAP